MKSTYKAPTTLQRLLKDALNAVDTIKKNKRYKLNMAEWHTPKTEGVCCVCIAGAWLARFIVKNPRKHIDPYLLVDNTIPEKIKVMARALNIVRLWFWSKHYFPERPAEVVTLIKKWEKKQYDVHNTAQVIEYFRELEATIRDLPPIVINPSTTIC